MLKTVYSIFCQLFERIVSDTVKYNIKFSCLVSVMYNKEDHGFLETRKILIHKEFIRTTTTTKSSSSLTTSEKQIKQSLITK